MKIVTSHIHPPIPVRSHDWIAHFEGDEEGAVAYGATSAEAVANLLNAKEAQDAGGAA